MFVQALWDSLINEFEVFMRAFIKILFSLALFFCSWLSSSIVADTAVLRIPKVSRPPQLADFINGTPREAEAAVSDFVQFDPNDGAAVTQPTTAFLSYDDKNLYVGWICKDDSAKIRANFAKRDQLLTEDRVSISLDCFHDHHRSYFFDANPYGIQMDGVTVDMKDDFNFDTLWYSEGKMTGEGYVVLETIPFKSLRFPTAPVQEWGIALNRMITRNNEMSCWPYITRRNTGWSAQFATLKGLEAISQGRNWQFIPYGLFSASRYLKPESGGLDYQKSTEARAGLDSKIVLKDAFTLDLALNPDFSQVESDEPQVTINQRYEVYFPEKRPFFLENANYFETPEQLFFSRRVVNPQFGARLTGKARGWGIGFLAADDRAPGQVVEEGDPLHGDRAGVGVFRLYREFGRENRIGMLATSRDFAGSFNRVIALDTRLKLNSNWTFTGQWMGSESKENHGRSFSAPAYKAQLSHWGKHFQFEGTYLDRGAGFRSDLGFIQRVDIRSYSQALGYTWRPEKSALVAFGPRLGAEVIWNRQGQLQDWEVEPEFVFQLTRMTELGVERSEAFERFGGQEFRKNHTRIYGQSAVFKWLSLEGSNSVGTSLNYYPVGGLPPFLGDANNTSFSLTLKPGVRLNLVNSYIMSRLRTGFVDDWPVGIFSPRSIFNNHIFRTKANYQFNRELSLRAIFDYNTVLPNSSLVSLEKTKRFGADVLLTYLLNPGTALYVGYTDIYENWALDPTVSPRVWRSNSPVTSVGRQFFVKLSYLFRM